VPSATNALQHPRAAGNIETRLPLAVVSATSARRESPKRGETNVAIEEKSLALEVRGAPGSEVYLDNAFRGRIRPNGLLVVEAIARGAHELSVDPPGGETLTQTLELAAARTVLDLTAAVPAEAAKKSSPLVAQIKEYLSKDQVLENGGAWDIYKKMVADSPTEPQRKSLEVALSSVLEEIGQQAINDYVRSPEKVSQLKKAVFPHAAKAFMCLMRLRPEDKIVESKQLFCAARMLIDDGKSKEAIPMLQRAITFDPKAAYLHNALAVAYRQEKDPAKALESFTRAATLAPNWTLPRFQIGVSYFLQNQYDKAANEFTQAVALDPSDSISRLMLARSRRGEQNYAQAEKDVQE
jgi:tetratricopeptide (TPR) repeat protein